MSIRSKILAIIAILMAAFLVSMGVYYQNTSSMLAMFREEGQLAAVREQTAAQGEALNAFFWSPLEEARAEYDRAFRSTDQALAALDSLKVLPSKSKEIAVALEVIITLEHVLSSRVGRLHEGYDAMLDRIRQIDPSADSLSLIGVLSAQAFRGQEPRQDAREAIQTFLSRQSVMRGTLETSRATMDSQSEIIHREIQAVRARGNLLSFSSMAALLALALVMSVITARRIVRPLKRMQQGVGLLSQGDLTRTFARETRDEVGALGADLDRFSLNLRSAVREIQSVSIRNVKARQQLASSLEASQGAFSAIGRKIQAIEESSHDLGTSVDRSTHAVKAILESMESLGSLIAEQLAMVEESTAATTQMIASISNVARNTETNRALADRLVEAALNGASRLEETQALVSRISGSVEQIQNVADVIQRIAFQTNLLAMNAAIEAAHAGQFGRGFAVVADEIRTLAAMSARNSKEITGQLQGIIETIREADQSSETTRSAFGEIREEVGDVSRTSGETHSSLEELRTGGSEILAAMNRLQDFSSVVDKTSKEVTHNTGLVRKEVEQVQEVASLVGENSRSIVESMRAIEGALTRVRSLAEQMEEVSSQLDGQVRRFQTE